MAFVSLAFLVFIGITAAVYFAVPKPYRWVVLLVASYVFFWINSEWLVAVLFVQTLGTFLFGLWIQRVEDRAAPGLAAIEDKAELKAAKLALRTRKRYVMAAGIAFNLGALLTLRIQAGCAKSR